MARYGESGRAAVARRAGISGCPLGIGCPYLFEHACISGGKAAIEASMLPPADRADFIVTPPYLFEAQKRPYSQALPESVGARQRYRNLRQAARSRLRD